MKCTWPVRTLSKVQTIVQRNAAAVGVGALVSLEALDEGSIRTHQGQSGLRALGLMVVVSSMRCRSFFWIWM